MLEVSSLAEDNKSYGDEICDRQNPHLNRNESLGHRDEGRKNEALHDDVDDEG